jgi:hypothetical protein
MAEINWPLLALACLLAAAAIRSVWRRAAFRLVFPSSGDRAGQVALVWFRAKFLGWGGAHCWLWLPGFIARRLWLCRSTGSGRVACWLRSKGE